MTQIILEISQVGVNVHPLVATSCKLHLLLLPIEVENEAMERLIGVWSGNWDYRRER